MLDVPEELKKIYRTNMLPNEVAKIEEEIYFPELGITIKNDRIVKDTFRLTETISSGEDLDFGSCNASAVEFTVADVPEDLTGKQFTVTQTVNDKYTVPLGMFTVESCKKQDDLRFKDIVAYDNMRKFDVDVSSWYNNISFPITVKEMRTSLCEYCGVESVEDELINDNISVDKTIETEELSGREVLHAIAEINGTFAHIDRYGKLKFIRLENFGLYPSEELYPSEDLYPAEASEVFEAEGDKKICYITTKYEDYEVSAIDGVIVQDSESASTGIIVGNSENPYVLSENMIIVGKSTEELTAIAQRLLSQIGNILYTPHNTECIGLPYVEVGDVIVNAKSTEKELFVMERVLTGVSSVMDSFSASGNEKRENSTGLEKSEIKKLKGRTLKLIKEIDRVGVEIENLETSTNTRFEVADGRITSEIIRATEAEEVLLSEITQTETEIKQEVSDSLNDVYGEIALKLNTSDLTSEINLIADNIVLTGKTTFSDGTKVMSAISNAQSAADSAESSAYSASQELNKYKEACKNGTTIISGGCITTGTLEASAISADFFTTASENGSGWTIKRHETSDGANYICGNDGEANNVVLKTGGDVAFACGLDSGYEPGMSTGTGEGNAKLQIYHNGSVYCMSVKCTGDISANSITANDIYMGTQMVATRYYVDKYYALKEDIPDDYATEEDIAGVKATITNMDKYLKSLISDLDNRVSALENA